MYKVLVVDDEPIVRRGIVNIINWNALNCEVIGESGNGVEGMALVETFKPDIIITDIHMPEIDGLEMIKRCKHFIPESKIIILTGFRDFDYLQEALKLGASDFLLKPSKIESITSSVKKCVLELDFKLQRKTQMDKLEKHYEKSLPLLRDKLLLDILFRSAGSKEEVTENLKLYDMYIDDYLIMTIDIHHDENLDIYEKQLYKFGIINTVEDIFSDKYKSYTIHVTQSRLVVIILSDNTTGFMEDVLKRGENFQLLIKSCFNINVILGVSTLGRGWEQLHEKMTECFKALDYQFYFGEDAIILYQDIKQLNILEENHNLTTIKADLITAIHLGNQSLFNKINEELRFQIEKNQIQEPIRFFEEIFIQLNIKEKITQMDLKLAFLEFSNILNEVVFLNNQKNIKSLSQVLKLSLEYIQQHYHETITLQDLADETYVSIYYLSRMFKKEIGKNFTDYINEFRMNKAKQYLNESNFKAYEVAEMVGVPDPHYFSKLFKKYTGVSPTEYRKNNN
ncbi:MAG: response regulator [Clostridia bacterium]|nr:response regulator [Clostridia bacterium]